MLEDLPGDHVNIAVQVRGGPSAHEATAWILVSISSVWDYRLLLTAPDRAPFIFLRQVTCFKAVLNHFSLDLTRRVRKAGQVV